MERMPGTNEILV